jgi:regulatory protein
MENISEKKALERLTSLCAKSEQCSGDMTDKMRRWGLDEQAQARIMQYLQSNKYVDDKRYSHSFVNDKVHFSKWGRRKIEQALHIKHVDKADYIEALDAVPDDDYLAVLRPMLKAKSRQITAKSQYEAYMKLIKYAVGRGFDLPLIKQCLEEEDIQQGDDVDF